MSYSSFQGAKFDAGEESSDSEDSSDDEDAMSQVRKMLIYRLCHGRIKSVSPVINKNYLYMG